MATEADRQLASAIELAAEVATRQTFGPFRDEEDSPFYEAEGMTAEATWERLAENVARVTARGVIEGMSDVTIRRLVLSGWHLDIFSELFPDDGGKMRTRREQGQFGVMLGTQENPVPQTYVSMNSDRLPRYLDEKCAGFERIASEDREFDLEEVIEAVVRIYVSFLNAHPFVDGNGRVSFVLLQYALARFDLPAIALPEHDRHQWCLGQALKRSGGQSDEPMQQMLIDRLDEATMIFRAIQAERKQ